MAHLNHRGPDESGSKTGRKLGLCKMNPGEVPLHRLGEGMGAGRHAHKAECKGKGRRLKASKLFEK